MRGGLDLSHHVAMHFPTITAPEPAAREEDEEEETTRRKRSPHPHVREERPKSGRSAPDELAVTAVEPIPDTQAVRNTSSIPKNGTCRGNGGPRLLLTEP
jgi:hypothetical protein